MNADGCTVVYQIQHSYPKKRNNWATSDCGVFIFGNMTFDETLSKDADVMRKVIVHNKVNDVYGFAEYDTALKVMHWCAKYAKRGGNRQGIVLRVAEIIMTKSTKPIITMEA